MQQYTTVLGGVIPETVILMHTYVCTIGAFYTKDCQEVCSDTVWSAITSQGLWEQEFDCERTVVADIA